MMKEDSFRSFFRWVLWRLAVLVGGTEAFGYIIAESGDTTHYYLAAHIRPDESDEQLREKSRAAFLQIAKPCVDAGKDGAMELTEKDTPAKKQFCLVVTIVDKARRKPCAVIGVIVRCDDLVEAKEKLRVLRTGGTPAA